MCTWFVCVCVCVSNSATLRSTVLNVISVVSSSFTGWGGGDVCHTILNLFHPISKYVLKSSFVPLYIVYNKKTVFCFLFTWVYMYCAVIASGESLNNEDCSFLSLELHVSYSGWAMALNMHHSLFPMHHFVHISIITRKLWPPEVFQAFSRQIKMVGQEVGVVYMWVCQKVSVAKWRFFFSLI